MLRLFCLRHSGLGHCRDSAGATKKSRSENVLNPMMLQRKLPRACASHYHQRTTTRCSASEHGSLFPKQESGIFSVEGGGMKAESVEGVIDVGGIESTVSIHPSVFDICGAPVSISN